MSNNSSSSSTSESKYQDPEASSRVTTTSSLKSNQQIHQMVSVASQWFRDPLNLTCLVFRRSKVPQKHRPVATSQQASRMVSVQHRQHQRLARKSIFHSNLCWNSNLIVFFCTKDHTILSVDAERPIVLAKDFAISR